MGGLGCVGRLGCEVPGWARGSEVRGWGLLKGNTEVTSIGGTNEGATRFEIGGRGERDGNLAGISGDKSKWKSEWF